MFIHPASLLVSLMFVLVPAIREYTRGVRVFWQVYRTAYRSGRRQSADYFFLQIGKIFRYTLYVRVRVSLYSLHAFCTKISTVLKFVSTELCASAHHTCALYTVFHARSSCMKHKYCTKGLYLATCTEDFSSYEGFVALHNMQYFFCESMHKIFRSRDV